MFRLFLFSTQTKQKHRNSLETLFTGEMALDQYPSSMGAAEMHDSFIVDIENLPRIIEDDHPSASSRITVKLQRNLSSIGSPRENRNKTNLSASSASTDRSSTGTLTIGGCSPKKSAPVVVTTKGPKESMKTQPQKTVAIMEENRCSSRKHLKHRTSFIDPRRVLLFFATLSSMGTMLLIYFTLSICKFSGDSVTQTQR